MSKSVYSSEELYSKGTQRTFGSGAKEAAFLLGGVGAGNVSVGARGEFRDWEIFNTPGKGNKLDYTFFSIYVKAKDGSPTARVLEARLHPPFSGGSGFPSGEAAGLPRFADSRMKGEYPFVTVDFEDEEIPLKVSLEAFTPFIPLNPEASGIPCAILRYRVKNTCRDYTDVTIAGSVLNAAGICGVDGFGWEKGRDFSGNINEFRQDDGFSGIYMYCSDYDENHIRYGNMSLIAMDGNTTFRRYWPTGSWWDGAHYFWDDFSGDGLFDNTISAGATAGKGTASNGTTASDGPAAGNGAATGDVPPPPNAARVCSLGIPCRLDPGEEKEFCFILSWYFPNRYKGWHYCPDCVHDIPVVRNHYAGLYRDSWDVGRYAAGNLDDLESGTRKFHSALFGSTLPGYVIDAVASNITVLRSPTCLWLEDGVMAAWEGCNDNDGCCEGTCTHVWNYAQTLAFLFPSLERSARKVEFNMETDDSGKMTFRTRSVFGLSKKDFHPAADGQMGSIVRLYREWKISGDSEFLRTTWEGVKRALDFAFSYWDGDGDCVLDSQQHNTYDIEFYGPNSMTNSVFFAALKAGVELSLTMGDPERAEKYKKALEKGSRKMDEMLWDGEYYIQRIDDVNKYKYQYGTGCLSDQLLGQFMAHVAGLGHILPEKHVKSAVKSVYEHNFLTDFHRHANVQRTYALNDEKGLLLCTWPNGGRPGLPMVYSDEVWTGVEYQVAAHLIFEGYVEEGLTIVKAVRDRHDGYRRNPWNEVECGHHYARSMASWAVLIALSGFRCDMVNKKIYFAPRINEDDFSAFWSTGTAWGVYRQKTDKATGKQEYFIDVLYGNIDGVEIIAGTQETGD